MEIIFNRLKESISTISLRNLYQLSQIINTEVLKRYKLGQLEGYFKVGDQIVFTDDDGCVLHGEVANSEEFHLLDPQYIFIKEIDPETNQTFLVEDELGNFLVSGSPMMNEAQVFKYALDTEGLNND